MSFKWQNLFIQLLAISLRIICSWKTTCFLLPIYLLYLGILYFSDHPAYFLDKSDKISFNLEDNSLGVPEGFSVARADTIDGTDSLNAVFLEGKNHFIVISGAKDCIDREKLGFRQFIIDSLENLHVENPKDYYLYAAILNGDTAFCYHYTNVTLGGTESDNIFIPARCLYFEVYGKGLKRDQVFSYLREIAYSGEKVLNYHNIDIMPIQKGQPSF